MVDATAELLGSGRAFADLSTWRKVAISGTGALEWLNDLVTADISSLPPGRASHALLLSPTGGVRASFTVAMPGGSLLLLQDPAQRAPIDELLEPYVLSSDLSIDNRTDALALFSFPGSAEAPEVPATDHSIPSCLGSGVDVTAPAQDRELLLRSLSMRYARASDDDVEAWRIARGMPRFGVDGIEGDLPQESGLCKAVSRTKGCFLGQEAVAKVDSLGHPRRVVLALETQGPASPGDPVLYRGTEVGTITSVTTSGAQTLLFARLRWEARNGDLNTGQGTRLRPRAA